MEILAIKAGTRTLDVTIELDEVVDYNLENGFTEDEAEETGVAFNPMWLGANIFGTIGESDFGGQVQYDTQNKEFSASVDGNNLYETLKKSLLSNFTHEALYTSGTNELNNTTYEIESDLYCDLINEVLPQIVEFVCDFGGAHINEYVEYQER